MNDTDTKWEARREAARAKHGNNGFGLNLSQAVTLAGWPASMAGTPKRNGRNEAGNTDSSRATVALIDWPASDVADGPARLTGSGEMLTGSDAGMTNGGRLSPEHSRWLMGYRAEWGCSGVTAMQSFRPSRRRS
jgi:hypothetical protein